MREGSEKGGPGSVIQIRPKPETPTRIPGTETPRIFEHLNIVLRLAWALNQSSRSEVSLSALQTNKQKLVVSNLVWRIRNILIRIQFRIQDVKKFVRYGSGSRTILDPANFLYGSGSREMIRILRIRIRNSGAITIKLTRLLHCVPVSVLVDAVLRLPVEDAGRSLLLQFFRGVTVLVVEIPLVVPNRRRHKNTSTRYYRKNLETNFFMIGNFGRQIILNVEAMWIGTDPYSQYGSRSTYVNMG